MKPLFYDFPQDAEAWDAEDVYLFGHDLLVAPVLDAGIRRRSVYLPSGAQWTEMATGKIYPGGQRVDVSAPLEEIPLFLKNGAQVFSSAEK